MHHFQICNNRIQFKFKITIKIRTKVALKGINKINQLRQIWVGNLHTLSKQVKCHSKGVTFKASGKRKNYSMTLYKFMDNNNKKTLSKQ